MTTDEPGSIRSAAAEELDAATLYELLRLRADIFVVEQACPYPELDGRDLLPGVRHWWVEEHGRVIACLRVLPEPDGGHRIGRVATHPEARRRGVAGRLLRAVLATLDGPVVLAAQAYLRNWYQGFGFVPDGEEFLEDGILHLPMRLVRSA